MSRVRSRYDGTRKHNSTWHSRHYARPPSAGLSGLRPQRTPSPGQTMIREFSFSRQSHAWCRASVGGGRHGIERYRDWEGSRLVRCDFFVSPRDWWLLLFTRVGKMTLRYPHVQNVIGATQSHVLHGKHGACTGVRLACWRLLPRCPHLPGI